MRKTSDQVRQKALDEIASIQRRIQGFELLCSGTLVKRRKVCGKPGCRCARDPDARHGPYYEWGFMKECRQVHRMVSREKARLLRRAIANYRSVRRLLRRWEAQSVRLIQAEEDRKPKS